MGEHTKPGGPGHSSTHHWPTGFRGALPFVVGWSVRASPYAGPIGFFPRHEYFPQSQRFTVCGWHNGTRCGNSHVPHLRRKYPHQAGDAHHDIIGAFPHHNPKAPLRPRLPPIRQLSVAKWSFRIGMGPPKEHENPIGSSSFW